MTVFPAAQDFCTEKKTSERLWSLALDAECTSICRLDDAEDGRKDGKDFIWPNNVATRPTTQRIKIKFIALEPKSH